MNMRMSLGSRRCRDKQFYKVITNIANINDIKIQAGEYYYYYYY